MEWTQKCAAIFSCVSALKDHAKYNKMTYFTATHGIYATIHDCFVTTRRIAFERYIFICRKQKKTEGLGQFHADLVELASRVDCADRESEWVRDMFTAHMNNQKIAEELLAQTRTPQEAYE